MILLLMLAYALCEWFFFGCLRWTLPVALLVVVGLALSQGCWYEGGAQ